MYMNAALDQAHKAFDLNEVPIGAAVVGSNGEIIGLGYNQVETKKTQCAHAEMIAIEEAARRCGDWRLDGCWMYVTLEPCSMCFSLMRLSRIDGLVFAASSPRFGYQLDNITTSSVYKKDIIVMSGLCKESAQALLKKFFKIQRKKGE